MRGTHLSIMKVFSAAQSSSTVSNPIQISSSAPLTDRASPAGHHVDSLNE